MPLASLPGLPFVGTTRAQTVERVAFVNLPPYVDFLLARESAGFKQRMNVGVYSRGSKISPRCRSLPPPGSRRHHRRAASTDHRSCAERYILRAAPDYLPENSPLKISGTKLASCVQFVKCTPLPTCVRKSVRGGTASRARRGEARGPPRGGAEDVSA